MSARIKLINCDQRILEWIIEGDEILARELSINIPNGWNEFGEPIFKYSLEKIINNSSAQMWWTYLPIHIETNTLLGTCGYKGEPNAQGIVEIGYEVAKVHRNQGYATEITAMLVDIAFRSEKVNSIIAHTLAEENASVKVLKNNEFSFVKEMENEEDGRVWEWVRNAF